MKPYPKTKPSGVQWLGDVPEHWEVKRLKMAAVLTDKKVEADEENPVPYIGLEHIESWTGRLLPIDPDLVPTGIANAFEAGSVLFGKLRPYLAKACTPDFSGLCSTELLVLQGHDLDRHSLRYTLLSEGFIDLVDSSTYGSKMPRANWSFIADCVIPVPSPAEQPAIAAYLDQETGRIDELVSKKRDLIERLKEKRSALISRTVTRGLPADLPPETLATLEAIAGDKLTLNSTLISSKVPWFDKCPSHWKTKRLRHISDVIVVGVVVNPSSYVTDEGVVFLLGGDVREMRIDTSNCKFCSLESSSGPLVKSRLDAGDLVVVRVGYPGVAAVVPPELAGGNIASMMLVRGNPRYCSQWLAYSFNSQIGRDQVEIVQYGAAQKQFNISHAVDFTFPFPPLPEQRAIASYLDEETAKLDALVAKVETAIERLHEYRTALITAAVTGKIDVRQPDKFKL
jgi:type I restriction enzyme S subunit